MEEHWIDITEELDDELDTASIHLSRSSSSSCITSVSELSIYHEFDCMIAELHAIQEAQHTTLDHLYRLQESFQLAENTDMETDMETNEEDELAECRKIIEQFHREALDEIESSIPNTFTEKLHRWIDSSERESEEETE